MEYKKHRLIWDYRVEDKWLNEMSEEGLALKNYWLGTYTFEDEIPGKYIYRTELLDPATEKDYLAFMKGNGVELVCRWFKWAIFRKLAVDGEFEIYSDPASKIAHCKRIMAMWTFAFIINFIAFALNTSVVVGDYLVGDGLSWSGNLICVFVSLAVTVIFVVLILRYKKLIAQLQAEKLINE